MLITAEIRYFWKEKSPENLESWFLDSKVHNDIAAGGGKTRTDLYLFDAEQATLGVKSRADRSGAEVKGLVAKDFAELEIEPFAAPIDLWAKWYCPPLELKSFKTVPVQKQRWIRKFDTYTVEPVELDLNESEQQIDHTGKVDDRPGPIEGCVVELSRVTIDGDCWWTMGFEGFGTLKRVASSVKSVATLLASRRAPTVEKSLAMAYPAWLCQHYQAK